MPDPDAPARGSLPGASARRPGRPADASGSALDPPSRSGAPSSRPTRPALQPCAGGIVFDDSRRLLVIRRGKPPGEGQWSVPGGRCHPGESTRDACVREVAEETGLAVEVRRLAGTVVRGPYLIDDFVCAVTGGTLRAGDDAADARWVDRTEFARLDLVEGLWSALASWSALPD